MPTYVYRCEKGHEFETVQGINTVPLTWCPKSPVEPDRDATEFCSAPVERIPQRGFFRISGAGVHSPGFK
jgi:putative FmdB family regulatory protein